MQGPFEIQPPKSPDFKSFWISNGRISDPHCIRFLDHGLNTQHPADQYHLNTRLVWYSDPYCIQSVGEFSLCIKTKLAFQTITPIHGDLRYLLGKPRQC